jgi:hypothetical protein
MHLKKGIYHENENRFDRTIFYESSPSNETPWGGL